MTREEFIKLMAGKIQVKLTAGLGWTDLVNCVQASSVEEKAMLINEMKAGGEQKVGKALMAMMHSHLSALALQEATGIMVDDNLNLTELNRVFGDG